MTVLITGASGFIGRELAAAMRSTRDIVCLSRGSYVNDSIYVQGSFDQFEDLRKLDCYDISAVVHLAAVTGGCDEEEGLSVNVLGTRRLYRYLLDRGCRKFITASSIAAVGCLSHGFMPNELPISDDHPCYAEDAYGFSKATVEELTKYLQRKHPDADFVNLRFGAVQNNDWTLPGVGKTDSPVSMPFVEFGGVYVSDILGAIQSVLESPQKPGVRTCNVVGPEVSSRASTIEALKNAIADRLNRYDLSYYLEQGNECKPIYAMDRMKHEFGFIQAARFNLK